MACILLPMTVHAHAQEFMMLGMEMELPAVSGRRWIPGIPGEPCRGAGGSRIHLWLPLAEGSSGVASMGYDVKTITTWANTPAAAGVPAMNSMP